MSKRESALESLFWRDEILQIMYWLRGEGVGATVAPRDLVGLLGLNEASIVGHLERLVAAGYVSRQTEVPATYQLSDEGVKEGGRRFADEFAGLTGQAHGECSDPDCDCRTLGPEACHSHGEQERQTSAGAC
jgi:hypothetical protein